MLNMVSECRYDVIDFLKISIQISWNHITEKIVYTIQEYLKLYDCLKIVSIR